MTGLANVSGSFKFCFPECFFLRSSSCSVVLLSVVLYTLKPSYSKQVQPLNFLFVYFFICFFCCGGIFSSWSFVPSCT